MRARSAGPVPAARAHTSSAGVRSLRTVSPNRSDLTYRSTLAAAEVLELDRQIGRLEPGYPMSFIEVTANRPAAAEASADDVIRSLLPADLDDPAPAVRRVVIAGGVRFERPAVGGGGALPGSAGGAGCGD